MHNTHRLTHIHKQTIKGTLIWEKTLPQHVFFGLATYCVFIFEAVFMELLSSVKYESVPTETLYRTAFIHLASHLSTR